MLKCVCATMVCVRAHARTPTRHNTDQCSGDRRRPQHKGSICNDPSAPVGLVREAYLLTSRVNSSSTPCPNNPRCSLLENPVLRCQAALHSSPAGLLPAMSRAQRGGAAAEWPAITAAPRGNAGRCRPTRPQPEPGNWDRLEIWNMRVHADLLVGY